MSIQRKGHRGGVHDGKGNCMKCSDCGGTIKFQKRDITCSVCGWTPSTTILSMYRLAPLTNRRILFGTLSILFCAGTYFILADQILPALVIGMCGVALVPINFAIRSYAVKKMMEQSKGTSGLVVREIR